MGNSAELERARIERAYELRAASGRDAQRYFTYQNVAHLYRVQERHRATLRALEREGFHRLEGLRILDVGCGDGNMLREYLQWGAEPRHLAGVDLRVDAIDRAHRLTPQIDIRVGCATELPWPDSCFDLVSQHTVFTSILDAGVRVQVATEMARVLRPGGRILWYDFAFSNPRNPDVRGVALSELRALFSGFRVEANRLTLAPFIARRLPAWAVGFVYPALSAVPILRTHILALLTKDVSHA